MIKKYEGFISNLFKRKPVKTPIDYDALFKLINDSLLELKDRGYDIKNGYVNSKPYTQITKRKFYQRLQNFSTYEVPFKFIDIKDDVLSLQDRVREFGMDVVEYAFVYNNGKGLGRDEPKYEDFDRGDYDNRHVNILTIYFNNEIS